MVEKVSHENENENERRGAIDYPRFVKRLDRSGRRTNARNRCESFHLSGQRRAIRMVDRDVARLSALLSISLSREAIRDGAPATFMSRTLVNHYLPAANAVLFFAFDSSQLRLRTTHETVIHSFTTRFVKKKKKKKRK